MEKKSKEITEAIRKLKKDREDTREKIKQGNKIVRTNGINYLVKQTKISEAIFPKSREEFVEELKQGEEFVIEKRKKILQNMGIDLPEIFEMNTIKKSLDNWKTSDSEKLEFINRHLTTSKRMIDELENTKVAKWMGGETNGWEILTLDKTLSDLIENTAKTKRETFKQNITEDFLKEILEGLKNRLKELHIYLKYEKKIVKRQIKNSKQNIIEEKVDDKPTHTEFLDVQNVPNKIKYETIKRLVINSGIDITEKVDKNNKKGNRKWKYTQGGILIKIKKGLGDNLTHRQENTAIKHIQNLRGELLKQTKKK